MLRELLQDRCSAIAERWLADTLATYGSEGAELYRNTKDPFANPVGNALRAGIRDAVESLAAGGSAEAVRRHLNEIVRIRAVQEFSASQALSFVFLLKEAVRAELGEAARNPKLSEEVAALNARIEEIVLSAFDLYVAYKQQVFELRVAEVKRSMSSIASMQARRPRGLREGDT